LGEWLRLRTGHVAVGAGPDHGGRPDGSAGLRIQRDDRAVLLAAEDEVELRAVRLGASVVVPQPLPGLRELRARRSLVVPGDVARVGLQRDDALDVRLVEEVVRAARRLTLRAELDVRRVELLIPDDVQVLHVARVDLLERREARVRYVALTAEPVVTGRRHAQGQPRHR